MVAFNSIENKNATNYTFFFLLKSEYAISDLSLPLLFLLMEKIYFKLKLVDSYVYTCEHMKFFPFRVSSEKKCSIHSLVIIFLFSSGMLAI